MPVAERSGSSILLFADLRERELVGQLPGVLWEKEQRCWQLPLSWAGCVQMRGIFGASLQIGPELNAWAGNELASRINPCLTLRVASDADLPMLGKLKPFQRAGVAFALYGKQVLIGDDCGLGKTLQAIAFLETLGADAFPALVACPNGMKYTWQEELDKWAPSHTSVVVDGGPKKRAQQIALVRDGEADILIINKEGLRGHSRIAGYGQIALSDEDKTEKELNEVPWKTVIGDEIHWAKDPHSKQTRALWWVSKDATYRLGLTATPGEGDPAELWALMRFISPEEYPYKTRFMERYAQESFNIYGYKEVSGLKSETRDELFRILDPRFIRRTKDAVLSELPPKTYSVRYADLGPTTKQGKAYHDLRKEMMASLDGGTLIASDPLVQMTRLVQFASAHGEINEKGDLILTEPSCKVDILEEVVEELGSQQAVIFAESRQLIEIAARRLLAAKYKLGQVTGAIPPTERQLAVRDFQAGNTQLLLLTLSAGGEGLTLHAASTAIFMQRSFSRTLNVQAEDRIHRIGQERACTIIDLITRSTIEHHVHKVRAEKDERFQQLARDEETLRRWLDK